jgi:hypothetical protein
MIEQPMQHELLRLTVFLVAATMLVEVGVIFVGPSPGVPEILVGRVIGWFEAASASALAYWYQTSHSSAVKNGIVSQVAGKQEAPK